MKVQFKNMDFHAQGREKDLWSLQLGCLCTAFTYPSPKKDKTEPEQFTSGHLGMRSSSHPTSNSTSLVHSYPVLSDLCLSSGQVGDLSIPPDQLYTPVSSFIAMSIRKQREISVPCLIFKALLRSVD